MAVVQGRLPGGGNVVHEIWEDGWAHFYHEKEVEARLWQSTDFLLRKAVCLLDAVTGEN